MQKIHVCKRSPRRGEAVLKVLRIMKLSLFLLLVTTTCAFSSESYSQGRLNIKLTGGSLPELFSQIKQQSSWRIFYKDDLMLNERKVSLDVKDKDIREVLDLALADTKLTYRIIRKQVAIVEKEDRLFYMPIMADSGFIVKGRIFDTKEPPSGIPGVTIRIKDSNKGVMADADGYFSINAEKNDVLLFSLMGFEPQEYTVTKATNSLTISLKENVSALDEVVVVGLSEMQRKHIASAVGSINVESQIAGKPITQISQSLQGGVTGLQVRQGSGLPGGDAATIKIRGLSTTNSSGGSPLVLVDGIPMDMNFIDPLTVESVTVLKDAAAAAIYGARAGNGVILVTTKRGVPGRVQVTYDGYYGIQTPSTMPKLVDAATYMKMYNEAQVNAGKPVFYTQNDIDQTIAGTDPIKYPNTDWQKEVIDRTTPITSHSLSVSGGNNMARFALSANYQYHGGMVPDNDSKKYNIRANTSVSLSKKFTVFMDMMAIKRNVTYPNRPNNFDGNRILEDIYRVPPTILPKYPSRPGKPDSYGRYVDIANPIAYAEKGGERKFESMQSSINLQPKWEVFPGFNLKGQFSYRLNSDATRTRRDNFYFFDYYNNNLVQTWALQRTYETARGTYYYASGSADYTFDLKKHHFFAMLGTSVEQQQSGEWDIASMFSTFAKVNYSYDDKYLLEAALRMDGSSKFGPGNKYGYFPSVAVGWNIHKENFLKDSRAISNLKLRASYGQLGNQDIGAYRYQNLINTSSGVEEVWGNPDITWETVKMTDLGFDLGLFKNKVEVTFDYYDKKTSGILLEPPVSYVGGLGKVPLNAGEVSNKGWELAVNYNERVNKDFGFSVRPGITYNRNRILLLIGGPYITPDLNTSTINQNNGPVFGIYGYQANGLLQTSDFGADGKGLVPVAVGQKPGDIRYMDQNADGLIDSRDQKLIGNANPEYNYFANFRVDYKNWDLEWLIQGVSHADIAMKGMLAYPLDMSADGGVPTQYYAENYWTPERPNARFPRLNVAPESNKASSTFWFQNGAYMRMKFIQLGYNLRSAKLKRAGIQGVRLYANAQNPFVITSMKLVDPESQGNQWTYGIMKTYMLGATVQF